MKQNILDHILLLVQDHQPQGRRPHLSFPNEKYLELSILGPTRNAQRYCGHSTLFIDKRDRFHETLKVNGKFF